MNYDIETDRILTEKCIEKFIDGTDVDENSILGTPSKCLIVYHVIPKKNKKQDYGHLICEKLSAVKYSNGTLSNIPKETKPDISSAGKAFFKETYAEYGYDEKNVKAFLNIFFGPRYASGYEYDIVTDNSVTRIINEKMIWIS